MTDDNTGLGGAASNTSCPDQLRAQTKNRSWRRVRRTRAAVLLDPGRGPNQRVRPARRRHEQVVAKRPSRCAKTILVIAFLMVAIIVLAAAILMAPGHAAQRAGTVVFKDILRGLLVVFGLGVMAGFRALMTRGHLARARRNPSFPRHRHDS